MSDPRHPRDDARFDEELSRIAGDLASEPLPPGIFDVVRPGHASGFDGVRTRQSMPGFAAAVTAVLVLVLATTAVVAPGFLTAPSATRPPVQQTLPPKPVVPALRLPAAVRADLEALEWTCKTGEKLESIAPGEYAMVQEAAVCVAPTDARFTIALTVGTSKANQVVQLALRADLVGGDTEAGRVALAAEVADAVSRSITNYGNAVVTKYWILNRLPLLELGSSYRLDLNGFGVFLERLGASGGYVLHVDLQVPNS